MIRPLPKPLLQSKPKRLPERKAVTIIAGFKCDEGVVICADTQESVEGSPSKRHVPKLRFEPSGQYHSGDDVAAAFCGSGNGPFIDKLIENAWQEAQTATNLDEACNEIEESLTIAERALASGQKSSLVFAMTSNVLA